MTDGITIDLQVLKNALAACVLPPGPWLLLAVAGAWQARRRPRLGVGVSLVASVALWASSCLGMGRWLEHTLLHEPAALAESDRQALADAASRGERAAIVILGGGLDGVAPEYGRPTPVAAALERVRYGVWLSRATGVPLAISGGIGWASPQVLPDGSRPAPEADVMGDIASQEFACPVRWRESQSRDTRENARNTIALLVPQGIRTIVLVTQGWHMPRALREFQAAAARGSASSSATAAPPIRIVAAPIGQAAPELAPLLAWMPTGDGYVRVRQVLREGLGLLFSP